MFPQQKKPFAPILQNFLKLGQIRRLIVSVGAEPDPQRSSLYWTLNLFFLEHIARKMLEYWYQLNLFKSKSGSNVFLN